MISICVFLSPICYYSYKLAYLRFYDIITHVFVQNFQPLDVYVKNVTENVLFVTHMSGLALLLESVTSATMDPTKADVSFAEGLESLMHTIAKSVQYRKKM